LVVVIHQFPGLDREQHLADMTNPMIVGEWGLDQRICTGDDYEVCHTWAHALRLAGFTGVFYEARHELRAGPYQSIAFFGDPGYQPTQISLIDDEPIPTWVRESARENFGIRILPSTVLF